MSQNLDPEAIDKFNESLRELNNSMPSFVLGISQILGVASGSVKASDALKNLSKKMVAFQFPNLMVLPVCPPLMKWVNWWHWLNIFTRIMWK
jgi:hypothetical protein